MSRAQRLLDLMQLLEHAQPQMVPATTVQRLRGRQFQPVQPTTAEESSVTMKLRLTIQMGSSRLPQ